jgi:hypothetical protein
LKKDIYVKKESKSSSFCFGDARNWATLVEEPISNEFIGIQKVAVNSMTNPSNTLSPKNKLLSRHNHGLYCLA